ncbi:MAG: pilus assembly protein PilP [Nitrospirae bacterium]|nr:pilus assembly protein PilP [Candidatus Manganitrophaceae bacterium]
MRNGRIFLNGALLSLGLLSFGCGEAAPPAVPKATPSPISAVVPKPKIEEAAPSTGLVKKEDPAALFQYNPEGRRDPFKSIIVASGKRTISESLPPLQRKELSEMRLIGIVWGNFGHGAIVQTPDGKGYPVRKGTRIGTNNGLVSQITNKEMVVEEKFQDIFGETKVRSVVMELHPQKEGLE